MTGPNRRSYVGKWELLFAAWLIALTSTLGALFIGEVMGQTPCLLCWYQRAFMFPLAIVLAVACFRSDVGGWVYALPLAAIGWLLAGYHSLLFVGAVSEAVVPCGASLSCSGADMTILGGVPIPILSLGAFTAIILFILILRKKAAT